MIVHTLNGCAPAPLAHYLKALGILRLVAEQADPEARGWWEGERFLLATHLDEDELLGFFLERYEPTPLVAPWNGGTGFYPKDKKAGTAVNAILDTRARRFAAYRRAIQDAKETVNGRKEAPEKKEKETLVSECRRKWRGGHSRALSAAIVLSEDGKPSYPSLFGTGLNDGRLDFSSNFMGRLLYLFPNDGTAVATTLPLLKEALTGSPTLGMQAKAAIGQFHPGNAGGNNASTATDAGPLSNAWDFVLMLEGAVLFTAHAARRLGATTASRAAAPFAVSGQGAGYASAADSDESARGEQWMPLWSQPITLFELQRLLGEGRAQIGAKPVHEPIDMARAVASLGTARGITAFQRYGYIERNGQANLAVPLGRFHVPNHVSPRLACLDDLDAWLVRLRRSAREKGATGRLKAAERQLADALFAVMQHPDESPRWQTVVAALANVEAVLLSSSNVRCGPIPPLRPEWVGVTDDASPEWRLAVAFALQAASFRRDDRAPIDPVRRHWVASKNQETAVVMQGRRGADDAVALVRRRLIEATQNGLRRLPLMPARQAATRLADLAALTAGEVDLDHTLSCARVLMAVRGHEWAQRPQITQKPVMVLWPDEGWQAIRLAMLPWPLPDGRSVGTDPAILRRLESGDATTAIELALRRLRAAGVSATIRAGTVAPETARLWAAALAFPIDRETAGKLVQRLDPQSSTK
jgi:CRISPR-associated protein Csx17